MIKNIFLKPHQGCRRFISANSGIDDLIPGGRRSLKNGNIPGIGKRQTVAEEYDFIFLFDKFLRQIKHFIKSALNCKGIRLRVPGYLVQLYQRQVPLRQKPFLCRIKASITDFYRGAT